MSSASSLSKNSQIFTLADYIASSHLSFDVLDTIQRVFLLSNRVSTVLISVEDDNVIYISSQLISDVTKLTPDTSIEVVSYNQWRKEVSESFAYDYDRSRFTRSTLLETLRYKVRDHQRYSFVAHRHEEGVESVVKYTFISLGKEAKFILATQQEITNNLEHDVLTGGLNRGGLLRELQNKMEMNESGSELAILYFNIQNFRMINEFYGDEIGDKVLQFMYTKLVYSALHPVSYARMESDKFVLLVSKENCDMEVIDQLCRQEYKTEQQRIPFQCQCGIYYIKDPLMAPINAINRAKLAISFIRDLYIKPWMVFEDYMQNSYFSDNEILLSFEDALTNNEFVPYFQPIVNARTGRIEMAEALVRWMSPKHGIISPALFIPILERHGGLSRIDMVMEGKIMELQRRRLRKGQPVIPIDINLSWVDFSDRKFVEQLFQHIEDHSLPKDLVCYEITETALSDIAENRLDVLAFFKKHGVNMLIDDFGQGYSFGSMKDVEFKIIKLDKSLIDRIGQSRKNDLLIESLISMFHKMNAKIIAEGVETDIQLNYLRQAGCDYIQGFYFYKPMDENAFLALLEQQQIAMEFSTAQPSSAAAIPDYSQWTMPAVGGTKKNTFAPSYDKQQQVASEMKCLRLLLDDEDVHIFHWNPKTHVTTLPEKFCKLYGLPSELTNMPENGNLTLPEDMDRFINFYKRIEHGEQMGTDYFRILNPDKKSYRWYRKTFYTIFDNNGFPVKAILAMQDCGDKYNLRVHRTRELMLTQEQDIVTFIYTLPDDTLRFNYLNANGSVVTRVFSDYLKTVTKENRLAYMIKQKVEDVDGPRTGYIDFYNNYIKVEQRAHFSKIDGEYGHLYALVGQAEDINRTKEHMTETIKMQGELLGMTESLRSIYNIVAYYNLEDGNHRTMILDKAYHGILSLHMDMRTTARIYIDRVVKESYRDAFVSLYDFSTLDERMQGQKFISLEYEDNVFGWMRAFLIPSEYTAEGKIKSVVFATQAIGQEKSMMERLIFLSEIDGLTQIRNRYSGVREITEVLQQGRPGVFGILDCDKFKIINDNYGHIAGDQVLVCIAEGLTAMNPHGINMRLGGDEFAFFLPGSMTDEQIHQQLAAFFDHLGQFRLKDNDDTHISVSVGIVAIETNKVIDIDDAYRRGDALLYQSKKTQGNAVTIERIG